MIAISEGRSKYSPAEAATDTRRFNDMDVFPLVTTGPEFQFIGV
ncbi:hypothetical protein [Xanthomonas phage Suba]|uniref:Uncharacterized protein n=1 Tax=Xanthomonas phage Suba TaxID=2674975 RepID=A0A679KLJ4_9CAUD|nr:hypothetical protein QAY88_gp34 [Xanthomonas phage Suba]CAA2409824.1 hypothetical protein [Xanthomonas phage Suba]